MYHVLFLLDPALCTCIVYRTWIALDDVYMMVSIIPVASTQKYNFVYDCVQLFVRDVVIETRVIICTSSVSFDHLHVQNIYMGHSFIDLSNINKFCIVGWPSDVVIIPSRIRNEILISLALKSRDFLKYAIAKMSVMKMISCSKPVLHVKFRNKIQNERCVI